MSAHTALTIFMITFSAAMFAHAVHDIIKALIHRQMQRREREDLRKLDEAYDQKLREAYDKLHLEINDDGTIDARVRDTH